MPAPEGYRPLANGVRCRCIRLWKEADGSYWCCSKNVGLVPRVGAAVPIVVPNRPTPAMMEAGINWLVIHSEHKEWDAAVVANIYVAMTEAARSNTKTTIPITAVWLRRSDENHAEVLVEVDGVWRVAIRELIEGPFGHIAEGNGATNWPEDAP